MLDREDKMRKSVLELEKRMLINTVHRPDFRVHGKVVTLGADTKGAIEIGFMSPSTTKLFPLSEISLKS